MAVVLEHWLKNFEDVDSRGNLGQGVVANFSTMLKMISEQNLEPAIEFIDLMTEKLSGQVPIIPYLCHIQFSQNPVLKSKSDELMRKYPSIDKLRYFAGPRE
jgi:hypothetical protein